MSLLNVNRLYAQLAALVEGRLWARVLLGLVLGVGVGALLSPGAALVDAGTARTLTSWLALPGDLFIRLVQMIMIPLVVASIAQGIAGDGGAERLARLGARVGLYFVGTTVVAIVLGLGAALLVRPGRGIATALAAAGPIAGTAATAGTAGAVPLPTGAADLPALITGLLPVNPLASVLAGEMLSIVIFAVIVGAALAVMARDRAEPMLNLLFSVQEICMTVTRWAMRLAPLAVFGLMVRTTARTGLTVLSGLGLYLVTVVGALAVILGAYLFLVTLATPISARRFLSASRDVLLLAFSVASSAAVMPLSMKTAEEKLNVPPEVARFVVPVGAIMNMNGTAAYQAIATLFLAQAYGVELSTSALALVVVTTVAASIGTPSAPGAGIIILAGVLKSAGVPAEGISLIIGVDHLLGMCRTSVNVAGDLTAALVFTPRGAAATAPASPPA